MILNSTLSLWHSNSSRGTLRNSDDVVEVVGHGDKQVKEKLAASAFHLGLHGAAPLEGMATADNEGEVVSAQARVRVGGVGVGVLGRAHDGADVNAGPQALFLEAQPLEFFEPVTFSGTVDSSVAEYMVPHTRMVDDGVGLGVCTTASKIFRYWRGAKGKILRRAAGWSFKFPRVMVPVVDQAGGVVTLVEVLEDSREDLRLLIGEGEALARRGGGVAIGGLEEGSLAQDVLMRGKDASVPAHRKRDDGRRSDRLGRAKVNVRERSLQLCQLRRVRRSGRPRPLQPSGLVDACMVVVRPKRAFE